MEYIYLEDKLFLGVTEKEDWINWQKYQQEAYLNLKEQYE